MAKKLLTQEKNEMPVRHKDIKISSPLK